MAPGLKRGRLYFVRLHNNPHVSFDASPDDDRFAAWTLCGKLVLPNVERSLLMTIPQGDAFPNDCPRCVSIARAYFAHFPERPS